jgi:essential nuclear protein 1
MPRAPKPTKQRHDPLHVEIEQDDSLRRFGRVSKPSKRRGQDDEDDHADQRVSLIVRFFEELTNARSVRMHV